jgi:hypothetical protein
LAVLERRQDRDLVTREKLLKIRSALATRLKTIADAVVEEKPIAPFRETSLEAERFPPDSSQTWSVMPRVTKKN